MKTSLRRLLNAALPGGKPPSGSPTGAGRFWPSDLLSADAVRRAAASRLLLTLAALAAVITVVAILTRLGGGTAFGPAGSFGTARPGDSAALSGEVLSPAEAGGQLPDGQRLIQAAAAQLSQGTSISAQLHQRIKLFENDVLGVGSYHQEAFQDGGRFHLQLRTKTGALLVVSDGNYLWHQLAIGETRRITRMDLQYDRLAGPETARGAAAIPFRQRAVSPLELGGIGHLLSELARRYRFEQAHRKVLSDVPIYELKGILEPDQEATVREVASSKQPGSPTAAGPKTPPQVPSHVTLSLGQDDLFPYRVVFDCPQAGSAEHERGVPRRIEIQFSEVSLGEPIDNRWFEYSRPRDAAWEEVPLPTRG